MTDKTISVDKNQINQLKQELAEFISAHWGEKCPDYEESCHCCRAWEYYEFLFQFTE